MEAINLDNAEFEVPPLSRRQLFAFFTMIVGMFMAILDIQIVASSISVIGAGLSASQEELAWVQTAYLIAEVIVIPLTGFIARVFSTKIAYAVATAGFTIMSFFCSIAWNIESMIVFRALQGFFGGAMIPTVFATSFMIFPKSKRPIVSMVIGLVVSVAPTIGPTLGGYITDAISWHFIFLINIIPGIIVTISVYLYADYDKPNYSLLNNIDYIGILLITICLATFQYILEEGNSKGWLNDNLILSLSILVLLSFIAFLTRELTCNYPIIDLYAFADKNFTVGCMLSIILGIGLYCSIYLLPLYLSIVAHMDTLQIGLVMIITGLFQFVSAPAAAKFFNTIKDKRLMLVFGMCLYGIGCFMNSYLTADSRFAELFIPQAIRGFSLMFCFMPINNITLDTIPRHRLQNASGLYNLMRNLGGAIGLALINSYVVNNSKILASYFSEHLSNTSPKLYHTVQSLKGLIGSHSANLNQGALTIIKQSIQQQAYIISINNAFMIIAIFFVIGSMFVFLTDKSHE